MSAAFVTRFAPSPTGPLHLGHAYSAVLAYDMARKAGGRFLLRIDDLDQSRSRRQWEDQIYEDLMWLGLSWDGPVRRQSEHFDTYRDRLTELSRHGALYPCRCKRRDIEAAASAPQEGMPRFGPDGLIYPGTCRGRPMSERQSGDALRFNLDASDHRTPLSLTETGAIHAGTHPVTLRDLKARVGDPVLARGNMAASYHFAVVLDDADSGVTHVVRGEDLFEASFLQRFLQAELGLPPVKYHHHRLIRDGQGKRLAKRDDARAIARYREDGLSPSDVRALAGL